MATASGLTKDGISFGPFSLVVSERLLTKEGVPVELGARALDILIALISAPNEVLSKKDLMSRVWPDVDLRAIAIDEAGRRSGLMSVRLFSRQPFPGALPRPE